MPRRSTPQKATGQYWQQRLKSPTFARELRRLIADDVRALAALTFNDVLDVDLLRDLIDRWDELLAVETMATIGTEMRTAVRARVRRTKRSLRGIMGPGIVAEIDAAIDDATNLSRYAEGFIEPLMQRELIDSLMTDVVYTAIVSFNRRVNPLFGNLALMAIDTQIKSFIRMFMPMLQRQVTAFLMDRRNHALFSDFTRAAVRQLLDQPLPRLLELLDRGDRDRIEAQLAKLARDPQLRRLLRNVMHVLLDTMMDEIGTRRVGSVLGLDANIDWLAKRLAQPVVAVLGRPHVAAFMNREIALAMVGASERPATRRKG